MSSLTLLGGSIILGLALVADSSSTISLCVTVITVRGITFLCKKITETINKDASDLINFAGWSLAGISIVKILKLSIQGVTPIAAKVAAISNFFTVIGNNLDKFQQFADKLTFWS